ncbi:hypothetical protein HPB48_014645 [Haemaphysalis longicornis]|uniref:THAP-type domain-containing protein n=1 Tax=Haemaphysalis longicornis TaxID=44386 RepID=A0A9J6GLD1_HAELO|nr:hypothetical protein HPB48_014645 [Haemaphysalis longicornis]
MSDAPDRISFPIVGWESNLSAIPTLTEKCAKEFYARRTGTARSLKRSYNFHVEQCSDSVAADEQQATKTIQVSKETAQDLERGTHKQSTSTTWQNERRLRLTSSKFGTVLTRKVWSTKGLQNLTTTRDLSRVPSIKHGIATEPLAAQHYEEVLNNLNHGVADPVHFEAWQRAVPRANKSLDARSALCERHFDEQYIYRCFTHAIKGETVEIPKERPLLKADAVPTVLPNVPAYLSKKASKKRTSRASTCGLPTTIRRQEPSLSAPACDEATASLGAGSDCNELPVLILPAVPDISKCGLPSAYWPRHLTAGVNGVTGV